jgi:hypothetical protein
VNHREPRNAAEFRVVRPAQVLRMVGGMKSSLGLGVLLVLASAACGSGASDPVVDDGGVLPDGGSAADTGGTKDGSVGADSSTPPDAAQIGRAHV